MHQSDIADDFIAVFFIQNIFAQQLFASSSAKWSEVDVPRFELCPRVVESVDSSRANEDAAALACGDKPQNFWRLGATPWNDNNVVDFANGLTAGVKQGQTHDSKCI